MTTYYGVWSGKEWYRITNGLFHIPSLGVARAQAAIVSGWFPQTTWEARAIGEDGLPTDMLCEGGGAEATVTVQTGEDFLRKHLIPKRFREYMRDFVGRRCMP